MLCPARSRIRSAALYIPSIIVRFTLLILTIKRKTCMDKLAMYGSEPTMISGANPIPIIYGYGMIDQLTLLFTK